MQNTSTALKKRVPTVFRRFMEVLRIIGSPGEDLSYDLRQKSIGHHWAVKGCAARFPELTHPQARTAKSGDKYIYIYTYYNDII